MWKKVWVKASKWAMGTSGSFKIVRTTASYFFSPSGHGKWAKTVLFRIFANYSNAKNFRRYPRVPYESWRPGDSENVVVFYSIIFQTRLMGVQSQRSLKIWVCHQNYAVSQKKDTATILRFRSNRWISMEPYLLAPCWFNDLTWIAIL